jgi:hypothetical protein
MAARLICANASVACVLSAVPPRLFRLSGANRSGDLIEYVARELDWLRGALINAAPRGQDPLQLDG